MHVINLARFSCTHAAPLSAANDPCTGVMYAGIQLKIQLRLNCSVVMVLNTKNSIISFSRLGYRSFVLFFDSFVIAWGRRRCLPIRTLPVEGERDKDFLMILTNRAERRYTGIIRWQKLKWVIKTICMVFHSVQNIQSVSPQYSVIPFTIVGNKFFMYFVLLLRHNA